MLAGSLKRNEIPSKHGETSRLVKMNDLRTDIELMNRIAHRDDAAFHQLYLEYGQRMYAYALRLTDDKAKADDVVQDALVAVWGSARSFRGTNRLLAWLLGIVHHTAIKSLRHSTNPITDEMENSLEDEISSPEDQVQANERTQRIQAGLQKLSSEHRAVLDLVFYQGLSLNEVAVVCGCPLGTVKSRLCYARSHLKGILTGLEEVR
jgi:RNA polymerase sigma-70 factor, ECF subfamily